MDPQRHLSYRYGSPTRRFPQSTEIEKEIPMRYPMNTGENRHTRRNRRNHLKSGLLIGGAMAAALGLATAAQSPDARNDARALGTGSARDHTRRHRSGIHDHQHLLTRLFPRHSLDRRGFSLSHPILANLLLTGFFLPGIFLAWSNRPHHGYLPHRHRFQCRRRPAAERHPRLENPRLFGADQGG